MSGQELAERIVACTATLYRVSYGLLNAEADREDAVQNAIEKAWRKADKLRDDSKFKAWLTRILINECYVILRKKAHETPNEPLISGLAQCAAPAVDSALREAIMALPKELRLPIVLHYMEGFSTQEVASALRCPKGTVLTRMARGRKLLKVYLTKEDVPC